MVFQLFQLLSIGQTVLEQGGRAAVAYKYQRDLDLAQRVVGSPQQYTQEKLNWAHLIVQKENDRIAERLRQEKLARRRKFKRWFIFWVIVAATITIWIALASGGDQTSSY